MHGDITDFMSALSSTFSVEAPAPTKPTHFGDGAPSLIAHHPWSLCSHQMDSLLFPICIAPFPGAALWLMLLLWLRMSFLSFLPGTLTRASRLSPSSFLWDVFSRTCKQMAFSFWDPITLATTLRCGARHTDSFTSCIFHLTDLPLHPCPQPLLAWHRVDGRCSVMLTE